MCSVRYPTTELAVLDRSANSRFKHWKGSSHVDSVVKNLNTLTLDIYNVKHQVTRSGHCTVVVRGTSKVSVVANVQLPE